MNLLKELSKRPLNLSVLYAEDEELSREEVVEILSLIFPKVITAFNGREALNYLKENRVDIIITDMKMPFMDGLELIENIRQKDSNIPIIIISGHSEIDFFLKAIKFGVDGYILKPLDLESFMVVLNKVIEKIELKKENENYKRTLEEKVRTETDKRINQEKILIQQSKLAAMGEMIDAIAHQWKQPLNIISMNADMLQYDFEDGRIDEKYVKAYIENFQKQIIHMLNTLENFRGFFRPSQIEHSFKISDVLESVFLLIKDEFLKNQIIFEKEIHEDFCLNGSCNEFIHLILNIINNSKDAFNEKQIENRKIYLRAFNEENSFKFEIEDNAGGIPGEILNEIFKANFTTKPEGKGTGIGLYISSQIAKKFKGSLSVENTDKGAKFVFQK